MPPSPPDAAAPPVPGPESAAAPVHLSGYQARDREVMDYAMYRLADTGLAFRGPPPADLSPGAFFAAIGAAQTFGCFCERPWPDLLARGLGLPALNLGYGGAGPEFFAGQDRLLAIVNRARFAVVQVMSARSQSNPLYECGGLEYVTLRADGRRMGAQAAFELLLAGSPALARLPLPFRLGPRLARRLARPRVRAVVAAARAGWLASYRALLARIDVPVILLWFSKRGPAYAESLRSAGRLLGEYPQLVTAEMAAALRAAAPPGTAWVDCVTARGSPQPLVSRFTGLPVTVSTADDRPDLAGAPWTENRYYPSPEMHEDAAAALLGPTRALLARGGAGGAARP